MRVGLESGIRAEVLSRKGRTRYRFHGLVGEIRLLPFVAQARLFRVDTSHDGKRPFRRISTFFPGPKRHDLYLDVGWWAAVLGVQHRPRGNTEDTVVQMGGSGLTLDMWHSEQGRDIRCL